MSRRRVITVSTLVGFLAGAASATAAWTANTSTTSTLTAAAEFPPVTQLVPTIVGVAADGQTLKLDPGSYDPPATSYAYEWLRCDSAGASCASLGTAATQPLAIADVTKTIRVRVTPKNGAMPGNAALSEASPATTALNSGPVLNLALASPAPGITGTMSVGSILTANDGLWVSLLGIGSRQWLRCDELGASCTVIAGATGVFYTAVAADRGRRLRFRVTGTGVLGLGGSNTTISLSTARIA